MGYKLKILSPVHIGCGEQMNGLNFILDNKKIYVVEPEAIIELLGHKKSQEFAHWMDSNSNEIARLDAEYREERNRDFKSEKTKTVRKSLNIKKQNFTLTGLLNESKWLSFEQLKRKAAYSISIQDGIFRDSEIAVFVKQTLQPYIPGSEIKGAIRTAVLYCTFADDSNMQNWFKDTIENFRDEPAETKKKSVIATYGDYINAVKNQKRPDLRKKNKLAERFGKITLDLQMKVMNLSAEKADAKYDIMKFFQVGDSELLRVNDLVVAKAEPFNMAYKFPIICEYLRPNILVSLTSFKLEEENSRFKKMDLMGFTNRHKQLIKELDPVLSRCHRFTADLLDEEIEYFKHHGKGDVVDHLQEIKKENTVQSPVFRIGKDEGYTSLTIGLAIKRLMPDLYENVLIHATKNKSYDSSVTGDDFYFPKSRKIVHWDGKYLTPGWVKLVPDEMQQSQIETYKDK